MLPQQQFLNLTYPNPLPDIPSGGNSPHPPYPLQFPQEITLLLTILLLIYIFIIPTKIKVLSLLIGFCFSGIEPTFYMLTKEDTVTGTVGIAWKELSEGRMGRTPHTTYEQFSVNLIFAGPFFLCYYNLFEMSRRMFTSRLKRSPTLQSDDEGRQLLGMPIKWGLVEIFRCAFTPLLIWGLEIVEGFLLIAMYGWNPAWIYMGEDAMFLQTINIGYWRYWIPLGFLMEVWGWKIVNLVVGGNSEVAWNGGRKKWRKEKSL